MFPNLESFLKDLFELFNHFHLKYVVLRNYENFPKGIDKPDIGILIDPTQQTLLSQIIEMICQRYSLQYLLRPQKTNILSYFLIKYELDKRGHPQEFLLKLDVRTYEVFKYTPAMKQWPGYNYKVFFDEVNRRKIIQEGCEFYIFDSKDELIMLLKQWQRKQDRRHREKIQQLLKDPAISSWFAACAGIATMDFLDMPDSKAYDEMLKQVVNSRWGSFSLARFLQVQSRALMTYLRRFSFKLPPVFYFSGPDGSGKTTLINHLKDFFVRHQIRYRYFYTLHKILRHIGMRFKWMAYLLTSNEKPRQGFKQFLGHLDGHKERDTGSLFWKTGKCLSLLVSFVDVWMGWTLATIYRLLGYTIIVETSPYDLFVKYHMPSFPYLEKIMAPNIPKPTQGILLRANPSTIHARKEELSTEEIVHYYEKISRILALSKQNVYTEISTDKQSDISLMHMQQEILKHFK